MKICLVFVATALLSASVSFGAEDPSNARVHAGICKLAKAYQNAKVDLELCMSTGSVGIDQNNGNVSVLAGVRLYKNSNFKYFCAVLRDSGEFQGCYKQK